MMPVRLAQRQEAAETFVMQRRPQRLIEHATAELGCGVIHPMFLKAVSNATASAVIFAIAAMVTWCAADVVSAQPPRARVSDIDYEASGFVVPAGAAPITQAGLQQAGFTHAGPNPTAFTPTAFADGGLSVEGVQHAGYQAGPPTNGPMGNGLAQVGFFSGSDCDSMGSCGCGSGHCGYNGGAVMQNCPPIISGGLLGKIYGGGCDGGACGPGGCGSCGPGGAGGGQALSGLRHLCLFCRGEGCAACQMFNPAALLGLASALQPYSEAGLCSQRWYDVSVGALWLGRTTGNSGNDVLATRGVNGTPVLAVSDTLDGDLTAGARLSGSLVFGVGGAIEATYMGGHEWGGTSTAFASAAPVTNSVFFDSPTSIDPTTGNMVLDGVNDSTFVELLNPNDFLYSFISDFGTNPPAGSTTVSVNPTSDGDPTNNVDVNVNVPGGFDDTDASLSQSISTTAHFHSGELNYRRRTVGPYCRFQGSWLFGLRYLRYDNNLSLDIVGLNNDGVGAPAVVDGTRRFFNASNRIKNDLFGGQIGGDLWWNVIPGVSFGIDGKLAWLKNEARSTFDITANSITNGGIGSASGSNRVDDGTLAGEFQLKNIYRLSHSWTVRSAYHLMAIDEVGVVGLSGAAIRASANNSAVADAQPVNFDSLVLNGFSFGADYTW